MIPVLGVARSVERSELAARRGGVLFCYVLTIVTLACYVMKGNVPVVPKNDATLTSIGNYR